MLKIEHMRGYSPQAKTLSRLIFGELMQVDRKIGCCGRWNLFIAHSATNSVILPHVITAADPYTYER